MGYFDDMETELLGKQEEKQEELGLKEKKPNKKVDLHVTIPQATMDKLKASAKARHLSASVLIQLLIDENC